MNAEKLEAALQGIADAIPKAHAMGEIAGYAKCVTDVLKLFDGQPDAQLRVATLATGAMENMLKGEPS